MGSCSGASCSDEIEIAVTGLFNELDNSFSIDASSTFEDADTYYIDDAQGYVFASVEINIEGATITDQIITSTPCQRSCSWSVRTAGGFDASYGDRQGSARFFEMRRAQ